MASHLNLGIVAHVDAGKTTLTEQILYLSGASRSIGRVDDGTAQTDYMPMERTRGISIKAAATGFTWNHVDVNLIDTPGHMDFASEVERSLTVMDAAILCVSAAEGVQAQTEQYGAALKRRQMPTLIFINKIDRTAADVPSVCRELTDELGFCLLDLAHPETWLETLAEHDDALADAYLTETDVSPDDLRRALTRQVAQAQVTPYLTGSALQGLGIQGLLDALTCWLPQRPADPQGPVAAYVYKVEHDERLGRIAHIRLYSGTIENRDLLYNPRTGSSTKIVQTRKYHGSRTTDIGRLEAGDIAAIAGLSDVHAGDVLGKARLVPQAPELAHALLRIRVEPRDEKDLKTLVAACTELEAEEPKLAMLWEPSIRELILHVTGSIQVEILEATFRDRFGLEVSLSSPEVVYKETPTIVAEGFDAYTMPKPCWAVTRFRIEPLPRGSGTTYESIVPDGKISYRYQGQVAQTVPLVLQQGAMGWEVTDCAVTLIDGEDHHVHTHPLDFATVTPIALRRAFLNAKMKLLEPLWRYRLLVGEDDLGKMMGHIITLRGTIETQDTHEAIGRQRRLLSGLIPVATSMDLPVYVAQQTSGRGVLTLAFAGYQDAPPDERHETPYRGIDPLDRDKYILHIRGALHESGRVSSPHA